MHSKNICYKTINSVHIASQFSYFWNMLALKQAYLPCVLKCRNGFLDTLSIFHKGHGLVCLLKCFMFYSTGNWMNVAVTYKEMSGFFLSIFKGNNVRLCTLAHQNLAASMWIRLQWTWCMSWWLGIHIVGWESAYHWVVWTWATQSSCCLYSANVLPSTAVTCSNTPYTPHISWDSADGTVKNSLYTREFSHPRYI